MDDRYQLNGELARAIESSISSGRGMGHAATALRDNRGALCTLLRDIAIDGRIATTVAADSYWHSNGFAKLNIFRSERPEFRLRLHVWPDASFGRRHAAGYENVHNHRWAFASLVLCGGLRIVEFEEIADRGDPKAVPCRRYRYETPVGSAIGHLRPDGKVVLRVVSEHDYEALDVHTCDQASLHTVTPHDARLTATLLVQGPSQADAALVYQRTDHVPLEDTGLVLTGDEVMQLAAMTLATMRASGWG